LTKAFVSFGLQKKFIDPAGTDGPFPAVEGGKDHLEACFSNADNNLGLARQNQDYLLFPILTGQHELTKYGKPLGRKGFTSPALHPYR